jgi:23S rRNA pseudouridine1911/1915/1917 synthase
VDKPAGLLAVPTSAGAVGEDTALGRVRDFVARLRPRDPYVGTVHRLDRGTSGALAFALSEPARQSLRALFRAHRVERRYLAIVRGLPRSERGTIDLPIHDAYVSGRRRVARAGEPSHPALTRYVVKERFFGAALVELELETGRQHQIRIHLSHAGTPILGDSVYGSGASGLRGIAVSRPLLHAAMLGLSHPFTGTAVRVEAPLPADFVRILASLRTRSLPRDAQPHPGSGRQRG